MEYTFKNSLASTACTVTLGDIDISVQIAGRAKEVIPYANIHAIRLFRAGRKRYRMYIYMDGRGPLVITNQYCLATSETEDRSRQYSTFVRILHLHLQTKSGATFTTGFSVEGLFRLGALVLFSGSVLFLAAALVLRPHLSLMIIALVCLAGILAGVVTMNKSLLPRYYQAVNIPLDFLP